MKKHLLRVSVLLFSFHSAQAEVTIDSHQLQQGKKALADKVISYSPGNPAPKKKYQKPKKALGKPDFNSKKLSGFVSLGCRGSLTLAFTDNVLFDDEGPDLLIREVGPASEKTLVEISADGSSWLKIGELSGNRKTIDLKNKVKPEVEYTFVRLTDLGTACDGDTPGADIDAVAVLNPSPENRTVRANTQIARQAQVLNQDPCKDRRQCDADGDSHLAIQYGGDDCDDSDPNRFPGNVEVADRDGHDEDCDPTTFGQADHDGDGYHASWAFNRDESGKEYRGQDCNDDKANINPRATEACDSIDNNCNRKIDEGLSFPHYADRDRDLFGNPAESKMLCRCAEEIEGVMWVTNNSDCNDQDPSVHPGNGNCE